jgi:large subunit ribosomal protein L24
MKLGSALSKELRNKYKRRSIRPREGDSVRILRGEYKNVEGKITGVIPKEGKVNVEGVTKEKQKGGTAPVPIHMSNVVLTNLSLDDKQRKAKLEGQA